MNKHYLFLLFLPFLWSAKCTQTAPPVTTTATPIPPKTEVVVAPQDTLKTPPPIVVGAAQFDAYLSKIQAKKIALVVNQTSVVDGQHLVDVLLAKDIQIIKIFAPEHGFRGTADAGEKVNDGKDTKTGLPVKSLYGKSKKPSAADLAGIDLVLFDIQDVGARFYTYISTMHYVMQSCAENEVDFLVLDRPNPNGHYVDGPILNTEYQSFVGMHPIPIVHGMTTGEYAKMINGEAWLGANLQCNLTVVPCQHYHHQKAYELPIKPSPNLPNLRSIYLYPSLCLFEGTIVNIGRGTEEQFQVYGAPKSAVGDYTYVPISRPGAKYPKFKNESCRGYNLTKIPLEDLRQKKQLDLSYLIDFYQQYPDKSVFFLKNKFFDKLAGTNTLREQILAGKSEAEIRATWQADLDKFKATRAKYLIYN